MNRYLKHFLVYALAWMPDRTYLKLTYRLKLGKKLDLDCPKTFSEKLNWIKLYYRRNEMTEMVDKCDMRQYVEQHIGKGHTVPLLGVWDRVDDIDFANLPSKFVLKCTHDCEGIVICQDKGRLDIQETKKKLKKAQKYNFYLQGREWPYKNVKPRIIAEQYMTDEGSNQLTDYKLLTFNGVPRLIQIDYDRFTNHKRQYLDMEWNQLPISDYFPSDFTSKREKPKELDEMIAMSMKLSEGYPHLRTDFYIVNGNVYVGELTFFHGNGMDTWTPDTYDFELGDMLHLPKPIREDKR